MARPFSNEELSRWRISAIGVFRRFVDTIDERDKRIAEQQSEIDRLAALIPDLTTNEQLTAKIAELEAGCEKLIEAFLSYIEGHMGADEAGKIINQCTKLIETEARTIEKGVKDE